MMKFKPFFLALFSCSSTLFAVTAAQHQALEDRVTVLEQKPITPPAFCTNDGWGVDVTGGPLYWKISQDGLEYAITARYDLVVDNFNATTPFYRLNLTKGHVREPNFKWDWGFRVGVGYHLPPDAWDLLVEWSRYNHSASDSLSRDGDPNPNNIPSVANQGSGEFISPFWVAQLFGNPGLMNRAKALFNLKFDMIDVELGREFYISKLLILRPFIGLRNVWIDQRYRLSFLNFDFPNNPDDIGRQIFVKMRNDMWGIGGRGGLGTKWVFGKGFSLCAEGALSVLYGFFDLTYFLHDRQPVPRLNPLGGGVVAGFPLLSGTAPFDDTYHVRNNPHSTTLVADFFLGICWDKVFYNNRFCIKVWAGYEQTVFFQQNRFMNPQYDFTLISPFNSTVLGGNEGPNYFTDRGNMTASGGSGGLTFSF